MILSLSSHTPVAASEHEVATCEPSRWFRVPGRVVRDPGPLKNTVIAETISRHPIATSRELGLRIAESVRVHDDQMGVEYAGVAGHV